MDSKTNEILHCLNIVHRFKYTIILNMDWETSLGPFCLPLNSMQCNESVVIFVPIELPGFS